MNKRFEEFKEKIANHSSSSGVNGWKNSYVNAKYEVAMMKLDKSRFALLDSWDISDSSVDAENLIEIVDQCKYIADAEFSKELYPIVTDNASNMLLTGRLSGL